MGSKSVLLSTLVAVSSAKRLVLACPVLCRCWRAGRGFELSTPEVIELVDRTFLLTAGPGRPETGKVSRNP